MTGRASGERGSVSVELAILAPLVGILLACVVLVGRVQIARADLEGAARAGARDLSIARDPATAVDDVHELLAQMLHVGSPSCRSLVFTPVIEARRVSVTLSCTVDLQAAAVLPVPGTMQLSASATEIVDVYREEAGP